MNEEFEYYARIREEIFKKIYDADIVAGKFAEKAGLEDNLYSVRKLAEELEKLLNLDSSRGCLNLLIGFIYQPLEELPGIARICNEQKKYFFNRAREYGIKFPGEKTSKNPKRKQLPDKE